MTGVTLNFYIVFEGITEFILMWNRWPSAMRHALFEEFHNTLGFHSYLDLRVDCLGVIDGILQVS